MTRILVATFLLVACVGVAAAEEIKGKVKSVDVAKGTLIVTAEGKDREFKIAPESEIVVDKKVLGKGPGWLKNVRATQGVVVMTDSVDGKEIVKQVRLSPVAPPNPGQIQLGNGNIRITIQPK